LVKHNSKRVLSFTDHLEELRVRIIITITFFAFAFLVSFFFAPQVVGVLIAPLTRITPPVSERTLTFSLGQDGTLRLAIPGIAGATTRTTASAELLKHVSPDRIAIEIPGAKMPVVVGSKSSTSLFFLSPIEPFTLLVKGALLLSALVAIPMAIYQLWLFVAPGLLAEERRIVRPVLLSSLVLFPLGAMFAYLLAHVMLRVLLGFGEYIPGLQPNIVASKYLGFILTLMLGFGVVFEFPLVLLLLSRIGVIDSRFLVERRKWAVLIISVVSAAVTPTPDPLSMLAMMLPLLVLYEISIWVIVTTERPAAATGSALLKKSR
jgi:sec-independent protein translocase protein TatC